MTTKHVIGQRIVAVRQGWVSRGHGEQPAYVCDVIELENGVKLIASALQTESEPIGEIILNEVGRRAAK